MDIKLINHEFVICKVETLDEINVHDEYCFISKTDEEISLICTLRYTPSRLIDIQRGYRGIRIEGILDFNAVGIIARLTGLLALNEISVIAVGTFNTDYIFIKNAKLGKALDILRANNYNIIDDEK